MRGKSFRKKVSSAKVTPSYPRKGRHKGVRRDKAALSSGCKPHPAKSLPPEAIGAVMEVTRWLKPSISMSRIGDSASGRAATRVNAEQASKRTMCRPSSKRSDRVKLLVYDGTGLVLIWK